jgi:hypothetical protein
MRTEGKSKALLEKARNPLLIHNYIYLGTSLKNASMLQKIEKIINSSI